MAEERKDRWHVVLAGSWHVEAFARTDRLPDLDKMIGGKPAPRRIKTPQQLDAILFRAVPKEMRGTANVS